jgi:hypothetical protein
MVATPTPGKPHSNSSSLIYTLWQPIVSGRMDSTGIPLNKRKQRLLLTVRNFRDCLDVDTISYLSEKRWNSHWIPKSSTSAMIQGAWMVSCSRICPCQEGICRICHHPKLRNRTGSDSDMPRRRQTDQTYRGQTKMRSLILAALVLQQSSAFLGNPALQLAGSKTRFANPTICLRMSAQGQEGSSSISRRSHIFGLAGLAIGLLSDAKPASADMTLQSIKRAYFR